MSYTIYLTDQEHQRFQKDGLMAVVGVETMEKLGTEAVTLDSVEEHPDYYKAWVDDKGGSHRALLPISERVVKTGK